MVRGLRYRFKCPSALHKDLYMFTTILDHILTQKISKHADHHQFCKLLVKNTYNFLAKQGGNPLLHNRKPGQNELEFCVDRPHAGSLHLNICQELREFGWPGKFTLKILRGRKSDYFATINNRCLI